jgi:hypothetical protein
VASEVVKNTVINDGNNSSEGVSGKHDSESSGEIDDLNHPAKKNKSGKSRNGRSRTSEQSNTENSRVDLSSEDVPSVEAAE